MKSVKLLIAQIELTRGKSFISVLERALEKRFALSFSVFIFFFTERKEIHAQQSRENTHIDLSAARTQPPSPRPRDRSFSHRFQVEQFIADEEDNRFTNGREGNFCAVREVWAWGFGVVV